MSLSSTAVLFTCNICANESTAKPVPCAGCKMEACGTCWQKFLLTRHTMCCMDPKCECEWTYRALNTHFSTAFVTGPLRKHREAIFADMEKALLPEAQGTAEKILDLKKKYEVAKSFKNDINVKINTTIHRMFANIPLMLGMQVNPCDYRNHWGKNRVAMTKFLKSRDGVTQADLDALDKHFNAVHYILSDRAVIESDDSYEYARRIAQLYKSKPAKQQPQKTFIRHCPGADCRGFLSTQWKCGLCDVQVCSKCHAVTDSAAGTHTCNPDEVASAEFLMKDTKPCPTCATPIHRIMGCDQMFCTVCHTAFDYKTGTIAHGNIHNPHYFEWMRTQNRPERNPLEFRCGRTLDHHIVHDTFSRFNTYQSSVTEGNFRAVLDVVLPNLLYLKEVAEVHFRVHDAMDNRELRIQFLCGDITQEQLTRKTFLRFRHNEINRELRYSLLLFRDVVTELVFNLHDNLVARDVVTGIVSNLKDNIIAKKEDSVTLFLTELKTIQDLVLNDLAATCKLFKINNRHFNVLETNHHWRKFMKPV